ncbi:hypothetical protein DID88_006809 [Monilinia fructigena]|uniref:JmjC domain-containing protein n=1 Tax=Monilinia fructigena TaxID=38457 RepID=A0A395IGG6_9HELO|nr:hypothetical protein DID88_006809 [Monilinia fructigena]
MGKKVQKVRDITNGIDLQMTMGHYLRSMGQLANQFTLQTYRDPKRQRLYLKDIDCPTEWEENLKDVLPEAFFYLNDCIESRTGGDGAIREPNEFGQMRFGKGVAPAGDLMSSLPTDMRALNMMCYIGHEGTYTPAHREMCASLGHNLMVETSGEENGEKPGSSIWFMTESKEREMVSEWFVSKLGHDIEVEKHFAQLNAWRKAPFNVWVTEQKAGDLILIPPLAPHQVWNRGTRTMKAAWNRTTVDTLELAIHEALPRTRLVCRDEQYKNKAIIYYTLENGEEDTYDVCMECYAMGRSCACISCLEWVEQWKEEELKQNYELWRGMVINFEGVHEDSPKPLDDERDKIGKKTVAQICQEQLALRPWKDITKPEVIEPLDGESDVEPEADDEGRLKKPYKKPIRRGRIQATKNKTQSCHICCHHHWNWQSARCVTCSSSYCYGTLWRAFDMMPQAVMEMEKWECPKCLKMCSCSKCRRDPKQKPYTPKGTLLGHDTKKVADYRSVESLVDFSKTNLPWLKHEDQNQSNPQETGRMRRLREKAEKDKAQEPVIDDSYLGYDEEAFYREDGPEDNHFNDMADIDPALRDDKNQSPHNQTNGFHSSWDPTQEPREYTIEEQITQQLGALDAHHDLDDDYHAEMHGPSTAAQYPSRLLAPVAPMVSNEPALSNPQTPNPAAMVSDDHYPTEGLDGILYDSPKSDSEPTEAATINPAELLASLDQFRSVTKKRRRLNSEGIPEEDEEDVEFFASQRQKKAKTKIPVDEEIGPDSISRPQHRPSRVNKRQDYTEPSLAQVEDLIGSEEETETQPTSRQSLVRSVAQETDDVDLAAKAFSYITKEQTTEIPGTVPSLNGKRKRGRPRLASKMATSPSATVSPGPSKSSATVKTPRKSKWFLRTDGADDEEGYSEIPATRKRATRKSTALERNSRSTRQTIADAPRDESGAEADSDDPFEDRPRKIRRTRPTTLSKEPKSHADLGDELEPASNDLGQDISDGSLFGNDADNFVSPVSSEVSEEEDKTTEAISGDTKEQLAESSIHTSIEEPVVVKKRRGRPRKKILNKSISPRPAPDLRSLSSSKSPPSPGKSISIVGRPGQFLSLREKLALKGKKMKIVSQQSKQMKIAEQQLRQSTTPSAKDMPLISIDSANQSPLFTPINETYPDDLDSLPKTVSRTSSPIPSHHQFTSRNGTPGVVFNSIPSVEVGPSSSSDRGISAQPVKNEPTVVRLDNDNGNGNGNENKNVEKGPTVVRLYESEPEPESESEDDVDSGSKKSSPPKSAGKESFSEESDEVNTLASPVNELKSPVAARGKSRPPI